jgi:Serine hydrolase (FSH1)
VDFYSYFHESAASILRAVEDLAVYAHTNGPFDGVIGFSQGAVLAATLLIALAANNTDSNNRRNLPLALEPLLARSPFRFAIFLCGGDPFDLAALQRGEVLLIRELPRDQPALINLPVVNCWASNDQDYPGMGPSLSSLCESGVNERVIHTVGHGVPTDGDELNQLVIAVRVTMERARRGGAARTHVNGI